MIGVRHALSVLLAIVALFTALAWTSEALACPASTMVTASAPVMHYHADGCPKPAPVSHREQICGPVCLGVLPALPAIAPVVQLHARVYALILPRLAGIDPALDPPPPRAAAD